MPWKPAKDEAAQLRKAGYTGLWSENCGCEVDDLYPCGERQAECRPGYKVPCTSDHGHEYSGEGYWCISPHKEGA